MTDSSRKIGEFLVSRKVLSRDDLEWSLLEEERSGVPLIKLLSADGRVGERDLYAALAHQLGVTMWEPQLDPIPHMLAGMLPQTIVQRHRALVVGSKNDHLIVAAEDPTNSPAMEEIAAVTGWKVTPALVAPGDLNRAIADIYGASAVEAAEGANGSGDDGVGEELTLNALLVEMVAAGASDLHLSANLPPSMRVDGSIRPMDGHEALTGSDLRDLVYGILTQRQRERFEADLELDTSHAVPGVGRFRLNVFLQRDSVGAVLRAIPYKITALDKLGVPATVATFATLPRGLVLVTGPTGSGKSTTLASIIDIINTTRPVHIMTVEDPIEFLHQHKRAVVNQREVGEDTKSFGEALKHVLRQDPDVVLVGEMRDLETISTAITAAETGHLVFGTLHTQDAPQAIDRVIDVFPAHQQQQIRVQLASALQAVVTQQLLPHHSGRGRAVACEILIATSAVRNLIREGKIHQIYSAMQAGGRLGMQTMDQSLGQLVRSGKVSMEKAVQHCHNEEDLRRLATASSN